MADTPDVQQLVTTKVAGLPLIAWAGGVGLVVLVWQRRRASSAPTPAATTSDQQPAAVGYDTSLPDLGGTAAGPAAGTGSTVPVQGGYDGPADTSSSNEQWSQVARQLMVQRGYTTLAVDLAFFNYLHGLTLSQQQAAIVQAAIVTIGPPPNPVQMQVDTSGGSGSTPSPAPPALWTVPAPGPVAYGSKGEAAMNLQLHLLRRGWITQTTSDALGYYGPKTKTGVMALQRALGGLTVDGIYGPKTSAAYVAYNDAHRLPAA